MNGEHRLVGPDLRRAWLVANVVALAGTVSGFLAGGSVSTIGPDEDRLPRSSPPPMANTGATEERPFVTALLRASWMAATAFGWAVGWAVGSGVAGEAFGGPVSAGIGGTLAGLAQGGLLARAGYPWGRTWALVSSVPVLIAVGAGIAITVASRGRLYVGLVAIPAIVLLTMAGQWWVLRKRCGVQRAGSWPLAVLAGYVAGGAAVSLLRFGAQIPIGASGDPLLGGIGGAILGGTMAAVNGVVLMWLLGRLSARDRAK